MTVHVGGRGPGHKARAELIRNLAVQSSNLAGAGWSDAALDRTDGGILTPNGFPAWLLSDTDATTAQRTLFPAAGITIMAGATNTASVYLKAKDYSTASLKVLNTSFGNGFTVNASLAGAGTLSSGAASGTGTYVGSAIEALADGWYRVSITGVVGGGVTAAIVAVYLNNATSYAGVAGQGLYAGDIQLVMGANPGRYVPRT